MTGYGQARWDGGGRVVVVEVRSVNGRYFKLHARVPREFAAAERDLEKRIKTVIQRGSVDLYVRVEFVGARAARPINKEALASYIAQLRELGDELEIPVSLTPDALASLPGVLDPDEIGSEEAEDLLEQIAHALDLAIEDLDVMRLAEGRNLQAEFLQHCDAMEKVLDHVEGEYPNTQRDYKARLTERVGRLLQDTTIRVGEQELAREIAIYTDRSSVVEEIARLRSHLKQFRQALASGGPAGRRLEFLAQEMQREVNTMGSKVADVDLSRRIIDLHGEVDKIREQVLNVE